MRPTIYLLTLALGLWSCKGQSEKKVTEIAAATGDSVTNKEQPGLYIKNRALYNPAFITGLSEYNEPIQLIDNFIITGQDTTFFPEDLPLNQETYFKGESELGQFLLTITRLNLTDLEYELEIIDDHHETVDYKSGHATLGSMFFFASEIDEDPQADDSYASTEYWDRSAKDCWLSLRIEIGSNDDAKQRAKISYGCHDKTKRQLDLGQSPTLITYGP